MLKRIYLIYFISIFFIYSSSSSSIENKILVKIENQIITSLDVNDEYKYLIALNPSLKKSKKEDIIKLSIFTNILFSRLFELVLKIKNTKHKKNNY